MTNDLKNFLEEKAKYLKNTDLPITAIQDNLEDTINFVLDLVEREVSNLSKEHVYEKVVQQSEGWEERFEVWRNGTPKPTKEAELDDFKRFLSVEIQAAESNAFIQGRIQGMNEQKVDNEEGIRQQAHAEMRGKILEEKEFGWRPHDDLVRKQYYEVLDKLINSLK